MTDAASRVPAHLAKHMSVFTPHALRRYREIEESKTRFVHYTSAEVGLEIIRTKKVWMRLTSCMNDYSEVDHGLNCLSAAWHGDEGKRLQTFLDEQFPGIVKEITEPFDKWQNALRHETYITSLSEHAGPDREDEDLYGRLSMWRGYAKGIGVALVIKQDPFWTQDQSLGVYTSPVAYLDDKAFSAAFKEVVDAIIRGREYLAEIGREWVKHSLIMAFSAAAVSTKHPGFKEEREWRVVRTPNFPAPCPFERVTRTVHQVPQSVLLMDLKDNPGTGLIGIEPPDLIERVIIGPTEYPIPIYDAYREQLKMIGVEDASEKVKISFLPLRAAFG